MNFTEYQHLTPNTAKYLNAGSNYIYPTLGIASEAGELVNKIKKVYRDKNSVFGEEDKVLIKKEIGDCLWYLSQLCNELGLSLDECASDNIDKLASRQTRGVLAGTGDLR